MTWLLSSLLIVTAIAAAYLKGQRRGKEKEELNQTEAELEAVRRHDAIKNEVANNRPTNIFQLRDRLRSENKD